MLLCIIQARTGSTRFPGKVLHKHDGAPLIDHVYGTCKHIFTNVIVAIPMGDKELKRHLYDSCIPCFEGPENDVLKRYYMCARTYEANHVVRVTGDCPFIWPDTLHYMTHLMLSGDKSRFHFASNAFGDRTYPDGTDCELMSMECLSWLNDNAKSDADREHVTKYLYEHINEFNKHFGPPGAIKFNLPVNLSHLKFSIDTKEDLERWTSKK